VVGGGLTVRPAEAADHAAIRAVHLAAFDTPQEADLVEALRAAGDALVELVAEADGAVVGHILFSPMGNDGGITVAALAPVAVTPQAQNGGIGSMLCLAGIEACRMAGVDVVVVLGHAAYYPRFGFSAQAAGHLTAPFSGEHFMALELTPGALRPMTVSYAKAFGL